MIKEGGYSKSFERHLLYLTDHLNQTNLQLVDFDFNDISIVLFFSIDNDGQILLLEGNALEDLELDKELLIGSNIYNISASENRLLNHIRILLLKGIYNTVIEKDEKYYEIFFTNLKRRNGDVHGVLGLVKDVTEDMKLKEELSVQKVYFSQLFENSPQAIVILDNQCKIININKGFENLFDYRIEELKGRSIKDVLVPQDVYEEAGEIMERVIKGEIVKLESVRSRKDGSKVHVSILYYPVSLGDDKVGMYAIYTDITNRKLNEEQIKNSLLEKEVLLKEVHHRVKNNLQIIASLLNFQSRYVKDPEALNMFKESQNRVKSIALIHEKLYQTKDLSRIEFAGYIKSLVSHLFLTFDIKPDRISFSVNANNLFLSVDTAIPCGLIINELVTNSLKYAFPEDRKGQITINLNYNNLNEYELIVKDNGISLPENIVIGKTETLGFQLINTLVTQLDAKADIIRNNGTTFLIKFKNMNYKGRL
jgi:PAS domain S-box-containing protein